MADRTYADELVLAGPVPPGSDRRVDRALDRQIAQAVDRGRYVNLTGGRQSGKTTSLLLLRDHVARQGGVSAYVDLSPLGETRVTTERWIAAVGTAVATSLLPEALRDAAPAAPTSFVDLKDYFLRLADGAQPRNPTVIIFDEVTAVPSEFRHPFFYAIRAIFNLRSDPGGPPGARSLLFVFGGSFDPERLIPDSQNSPFNVAESIDATEFDLDLGEIGQVLAMVGSPASAEVIRGLTSGHPYLTNRVISLGETDPVQITSLVLRNDPNIAHVSRTLGRTPALLNLAREVEAGGVPYMPAVTALLSDLVVLGLVASNGDGTARIRGDIYREVVQRLVAGGAPREPNSAAFALLAFVVHDGLRWHLAGLMEAAQSTLATNPTAATICMGAAVEGALMVALETRQDLPDLIDEFNRQVQDGRVRDLREIARNAPASDLKLAQMIEVGRIARIISKPGSQVSHGIRSWRNLVHPDKVRNDYPSGVPTELGTASVAIGDFLIREIARAIT
jgi:AAA-like domain